MLVAEFEMDTAADADDDEDDADAEGGVADDWQ